MAIKIAILGAGSLGFTRRLVHDTLCVEELRDARISLHDIDARNLDMIYRLLDRDIKAAGLPAELTREMDRRRSLEGADYVIVCVRVGGLEAYRLDIDIPLKYGIDQCVGDTLCAGGIMYGQRTIAALLDFCRDIRETAKPGALLLNYANPNAMNTWACNRYGGVKTIGLCHGVQGGHRLIAKALNVPAEEIDYVCAGINHQTWYIQIKHKGRPVGADELLQAMENDAEIAEQEKIRIDMLRRFGYFTTESNGHVSEYLAWYRKRPEEVLEWISMENSWIHGETGGYLRSLMEGRNWFENEFPKMEREEATPIDLKKRSFEHGPRIVEALETGRVYRGHFNVPNRGYITNLPEDCVVEVPGYIDRNGVNIPVVGDLPLACAATCAASVRVQEMAVEAAIHGDATLLKQAMLHDPLTAAVLNPPEIWQLADEMLVAQAEWLPQYAAYLPTARANLGKRYIQPRGPKPNDKTRKPVRSVEEIARLRELEAKKRQAAATVYDPDRDISKGDKS